ncbi:MAG: M3 family oligoendopeptidase [Phycisphaerales bacterium]
MSTATTTFIPEEFDASTWGALEPYYTDLSEREVTSRDELERWLLDRSELDAAAGETRANLYIRMTCHTDDEGAAGAWSAYLDEVPPKLKPATFALDRKQAELLKAYTEPGDRLDLLAKRTINSVELFRDENVPIETKLAKLDQEYDKVCGEQLVEWDGERLPIARMTVFLQDPDRAVRERAWRAVASRRLEDKQKIEDIFDEMIKLRDQAAKNAGFANFRDYQHKKMERFDYTPDDCLRFHDAVERHVVPFKRELDERRRANLGVDTLRPWDLACDERGRPALRPFEDGQELVEKTRTVFERLDPALAELFASLGDNMGPGKTGPTDLDLDSRKGKASGGYQYERPRSRAPFIFMNASGVHRDVETMVHEAGHAFHSMLCAYRPLNADRDYPIEFAEVASMTMELLTLPHWDVYYPDSADADRARRQQLEGSVTTLTWLVTIDAFQHWLYLNPTHTRAERAAHWRSLHERFGGSESWEGLDDELSYMWQRQGHLFGVPFYYIEYAIAQLGALGIWVNSLNEGVDAALSSYKQALDLGGSRPLPDLFEAAGVKLDFSAERVKTLIDAVRAETAKLPD